MKYFTLKNLGWVFTILCSFLFIMSGVSKVTGTEEMIQNFTAMNMLPYLTLVGIGEIIGVILLLYPRTSVYGALVLSTIMAGAVTLHLSYFGGANMGLPVALGLVAWTGHLLRTSTK